MKNINIFLKSIIYSLSWICVFILPVILLSTCLHILLDKLHSLIMLSVRVWTWMCILPVSLYICKFLCLLEWIQILILICLNVILAWSFILCSFLYLLLVSFILSSFPNSCLISWGLNFLEALGVPVQN